ncbi:MAG: YkgJ family cysteine cluster protein [Bacteroidales bacterium]|nr:YkgJ family cysteine cluster protein [Bacteroidales bacterium]
MDASEVNRIFFEDGYRLADERIGKTLSRENLTEAIRELYESMDGLILSITNRSGAEGKPVACRKGCAWCCHQAVFAVSHELVYLYDHILFERDRALNKRILKHVLSKCEMTLGKPVRELLKMKIPCPFLVRNACSIYRWRPMACRIYLSTSRESCRKAFDEPENGDYFPSLLEFPLRVGRLLNEGFVERLREAGLQCAEVPLEQGIRGILTNHSDPVERWLSGEAIIDEIDYSNDDLRLLNRI